ncbi:MAG TPA: hypothetical protein VJB57_18465 [Dehalococcoidia bacterium]|nr:hypothetical protein [Dehalococcoidia bacterium]
MDYRDALSACIDAVRAGEDPERAAAAYPEHLARLLDDVSLVAAVRSYVGVVAQPAAEVTDRARQRLTGELETVRTARRASMEPAPASLRTSWGFPRFAFAAVVAVVAVGLLALAAGIVGNTQTAEAETIDGVVVEKTEARLVLQTEDGLQTIDLDQGASITDESGADLSPLALEPGQVVAVRAKRLPQGVLRALSVQRRPAAALEDWCRTHPVRCQEVEPRLPEGAAACRLNPSACAPVVISPPPTAGTPATTNSDRPRLQELSSKCQQTGGEACEELRRFCRSNPALCTVVAGWLRTVVDLPEDARERLRLHAARCQEGSILDCRELRLLCERLREPCPVLTPQRPRVEATRPLPTPTRVAPVQKTPAQRQAVPTASKPAQQVIPTAPAQRPNP